MVWKKPAKPLRDAWTKGQGCAEKHDHVSGTTANIWGVLIVFQVTGIVLTTAVWHKLYFTDKDRETEEITQSYATIQEQKRDLNAGGILPVGACWSGWVSPAGTAGPGNALVGPKSAYWKNKPAVLDKETE